MKSSSNSSSAIGVSDYDSSSDSHSAAYDDINYADVQQAYGNIDLGVGKLSIECKSWRIPRRKIVDAQNVNRLTPSLLENEIALRAILSDCGCTKGFCLRQSSSSGNFLDLQCGIDLVKWCRNKIRHFKHAAKYQYIYNKFKESLLKDNESKCTPEIDHVKAMPRRFTHRFRLGDELEGIPEIFVCRQAFMTAYGISHWMLDSISKHVKEGTFVDSKTSFNDRSRPNYTFEEMKALFRRHGIKSPTISQIQASLVHNSQASLQCLFWMNTYFNQYGDHNPNSNGQVKQLDVSFLKIALSILIF
jgi:hypothetical protein